MLITRHTGESLTDYKGRLIAEVTAKRMSAEDAYDCYEEECFSDMEAI